MNEIIQKKLGWPGRMISGSKSGYHKMYPDNFTIFNANICTEKKKVWYGDLDLTKDKDKLLEIAKDLNETIYVFYEMDARFDKEDCFNLKDVAAIFTPEGIATIGDKCKGYYDDDFTFKK